MEERCRICGKTGPVLKTKDNVPVCRSCIKKRIPAESDIGTFPFPVLLECGEIIERGEKAHSEGRNDLLHVDDYYFLFVDIVTFSFLYVPQSRIKGTDVTVNVFAQINIRDKFLHTGIYDNYINIPAKAEKQGNALKYILNENAKASIGGVWQRFREYKKREKEKEENSGWYQIRHGPSRDQYLSALHLFGLTYPFTEADLKTRRKGLMKKYHSDVTKAPDEKSKDINASYDVLVRFVE